jgi:RNA polymerase sigma-70 factor (ECF subfamily)
MLSDDELTEALLNGDERAFEALARKYRSGLERLIRRYTRTDEEARDVTQIALLRAYEHRATFRGGSAFSSWLFRIGINAALNHRRSEPMSAPEELTDDAAFTNSLGTTRLVTAEIWRKVSGHLSELPPRQRLVVELRVFHDLSFEEIGLVMGSTESAAKMNYHHAVKALRVVIADFMK